MSSLQDSRADDERQQLRRLRLASLVEGLTLVTLVLLAMPAKYLLGLPVATKVLGPVHGLAFLAYFWVLLGTVTGGGWTRGEILRLSASAFVPFGAWTNIGLLRRKEAALEPGKRF